MKMATKTAVKPKARVPAPAPKKATPPAPSKSRAVVVKKNELDEAIDLNAMMKQDAGKGVSTAAEDNVIPLIYILNALSKQVVKQDPKHIEGAEAGMIWPRGTKILIDGVNDGLSVIPVAFTKWWIEWKPDRNGYVGRFPFDSLAEDKGRPADATLVEDPKKKGKTYWERDSGNIVVETREHAVLAYINGSWTGSVVSMSGGNHNASKAWMGLMKDKRVPIINKSGEITGYTDDRAPGFAYVYCVKTIHKTNGKDNWFGWEIEQGMGDGEEQCTLLLDGGPNLYKMARQLHDDFMSGKKVADTPDEPGDHGDGGGSKDDGDL